MGELKPYGEYKDSFFKNIPVNWNVTALKRVLKIKITDGPHETPVLYDDGIPFVSAEAIKNNKIDFNLKRGYISLEDHLKFIVKCKPELNDIFMVKSGATTGNLAMLGVEKEFSIWSPLALIRANDNKALPRYVFYFLSSTPFREQIETKWNYGTQQNIGMNVLENLLILVPSLREQYNIIDFLNNKTNEIDSLISDKEHLIELLEEKRQAVITEAVTKGLNPNVKMKDSGIKWIGEIPEHWGVVKIKYLSNKSLVYGANESALDNKEGDWRYIRITDIDNEGNLREDTKKTLPPHIAEQYPVENGDILFARSGATVGKTYIHESEKKACFAGYLIKYKANPTQVLPKLLYYYTQSYIYKNWVREQLIQATIENISAEKYANLHLPLSNLEEQNSIVKYLNQYNTKHHKIINEIQNQITKLKEYRESLIYETVTGKIDLRSYGEAESSLMDVAMVAEQKEAYAENN